MQGCTDYKVDKWYYKIWDKMYDFAKVYVKICAEAAAQCKTEGNAIGCAAAEAWAYKTQEAYVAVFAKAIAAANNNCYCDPKAFAFNAARVASVLKATVNVKVAAAVCVGPNSSASAKAWANCQAYVVAHALAKAGPGREGVEE